MNIGFLVFIILFALLSLLHIIFCFHEKELLRKISKPFLMTLLGISMCFLVPNYPLIPIACFLAMVGDIFMIWNRKMRFFVIGALFFSLSHVLNFITQSRVFPFEFPTYAYLIVFVGILFIGLLGYIITMDPFHLLSCSFASLHILNVVLAIMMIANGLPLYGSLILLGYLSCIVSDLILEHSTHYQRWDKEDFPIMLTYLLGQGLTYPGLAFAVISIV